PVTTNACRSKTIGCDSRRRRRKSTVPAHATKIETSRSTRWKISSHRYRAFELHQLRHSPYVCSHSVQLRIPQQAHLSDVPFLRPLKRFRRDHCRRTNSRESAVVSGNG